MKQTEINLGELAFQAEGGDPDAQYRMGVLFVLGESVEQDLNAAYRWIAKAAASQHSGARALLEKLTLFRNQPVRNEVRSPFSIFMERVRSVRFGSSFALLTIPIQRTWLRLQEVPVWSLATRFRSRLHADAADFPNRHSETFRIPEAS